MCDENAVLLYAEKDFCHQLFRGGNLLEKVWCFITNILIIMCKWVNLLKNEVFCTHCVYYFHIVKMLFIFSCRLESSPIPQTIRLICWYDLLIEKTNFQLRPFKISNPWYNSTNLSALNHDRKYNVDIINLHQQRLLYGHDL